MTMIARSDAWLVDERWQKAYPLADSTTIGRGAHNTIILRDPAVSRVHAEVTREDTAYRLHAFGSSGTKVNGTLVGTDCTLEESDVIEIAFTSLRFTTKAPTNEMFVVQRDTPTNTDSYESPTRASLNRVTIAMVKQGRNRPYHALAIIVAVIALLLLLVASR